MKIAACLSLCLLLLCLPLLGCETIPAALNLPRAVDGLSAAGALELLEGEVDLYGPQPPLEDMQITHLPLLESEAELDALLCLALQAGANRLLFATPLQALTLPGGGAQLAHEHCLRVLSPYSLQGADGLYYAAYEWTHCEGARVAAAALAGEREVLSTEEKLLLAHVQELLAALPAKADAYDTAVALHDLLCDACSYAAADMRQGVPSRRSDAAGALLDGQANCQGYADALQLLCLLSGIPCKKVAGEAGGGPHMWNLICVDGQWMYVDATFDDGFFADGAPCYLFFGPSAQRLALTHSWKADSLPGTAGDELFYYVHKNLILDADTKLRPPACLFTGSGEEARGLFPGYSVRAFYDMQVLGKKGDP